jgi:hypothetical protein
MNDNINVNRKILQFSSDTYRYPVTCNLQQDQSKRDIDQQMMPEPLNEVFSVKATLQKP